MRLVAVLAHVCCVSMLTLRTVHAFASTQARVAAQPKVSAADVSATYSRVFDRDTRPVILYDGVCNFCNTWVNAALKLDPDGTALRFSALQSETGKALLQKSGRAPDDISSIVLVDREGSYIKSDAILRVSQALGGAAPVLASPGYLMPQFLRDQLYDVVADNRYSLMGTRKECRCSDPEYADRFV